MASKGTSGMECKGRVKCCENGSSRPIITDWQTTEHGMISLVLVDDVWNLNVVYTDHNGKHSRLFVLNPGVLRKVSCTYHLTVELQSRGKPPVTFHLRPVSTEDVTNLHSMHKKLLNIQSTIEAGEEKDKDKTNGAGNQSSSGQQSQPQASTSLQTDRSSATYKDQLQKVSQYMEPLHKLIDRLSSQKDMKREVGVLKAILGRLTDSSQSLPMEVLLKAEEVLERILNQNNYVTCTFCGNKWSNKNVTTCQWCWQIQPNDSASTTTGDETTSKDAGAGSSGTRKDNKTDSTSQSTDKSSTSGQVRRKRKRTAEGSDFLASKRARTSSDSDDDTDDSDNDDTVKWREGRRLLQQGIAELAKSFGKEPDQQGTGSAGNSQTCGGQANGINQQATRGTRTRQAGPSQVSQQGPSTFGTSQTKKGSKKWRRNEEEGVEVMDYSSDWKYQKTNSGFTMSKKSVTQTRPIPKKDDQSSKQDVVTGSTQPSTSSGNTPTQSSLPSTSSLSGLPSSSTTITGLLSSFHGSKSQSNLSTRFSGRSPLAPPANRQAQKEWYNKLFKDWKQKLNAKGSPAQPPSGAATPGRSTGHARNTSAPSVQLSMPSTGKSSRKSKISHGRNNSAPSIPLFTPKSTSASRLTSVNRQTLVNNSTSTGNFSGPSVNRRGRVNVSIGLSKRVSDMTRFSTPSTTSTGPNISITPLSQGEISSDSSPRNLHNTSNVTSASSASQASSVPRSQRVAGDDLRPQTRSTTNASQQAEGGFSSPIQGNLDQSSINQPSTSSWTSLSFDFENSPKPDKKQKNEPYSKMEEELTCPVCLDLYKDPIILPCSHSLCCKCVHGIVEARIRANQPGVECPSCRRVLKIPKERMHLLPQNLALKNTVIRFQELCQKIGVKVNKSTKFCSDHPTEYVSVFCDPCKVPVCHLCLCEGEGNHAGHKVLAKENARKQIKEMVESKKELLKSTASTIMSRFHQTKELLNGNSEVCSDVCQVIEDQYNKIVADLKERKDDLQKKVTSTQQDAKNRLRPLSNNIQQTGERLKKVWAVVHTICEEEDAKEVICHSTEIGSITDTVQEVQKSLKNSESEFSELWRTCNVQQDLHNAVVQFGIATERCLQAFDESMSKPETEQKQTGQCTSTGSSSAANTADSDDIDMTDISQPTEGFDTDSIPSNQTTKLGFISKPMSSESVDQDMEVGDTNEMHNTMSASSKQNNTSEKFMRSQWQDPGPSTSWAADFHSTSQDPGPSTRAANFHSTSIEPNSEDQDVVPSTTLAATCGHDQVNQELALSPCPLGAFIVQNEVDTPGQALESLSKENNTICDLDTESQEQAPIPSNSVTSDNQSPINSQLQDPAPSSLVSSDNQNEVDNQGQDLTPCTSSVEYSQETNMEEENVAPQSANNTTETQNEGGIDTNKRDLIQNSLSVSDAEYLNDDKQNLELSTSVENRNIETGENFTSQVTAESVANCLLPDSSQSADDDPTAIYDQDTDKEEEETMLKSGAPSDIKNLDGKYDKETDLEEGNVTCETES